MDYNPDPGEDEPAHKERNYRPPDGWRGNVMIDPSLAVSERTYKSTFRHIEEMSSDFQVYFPQSFRDAVANRATDVIQVYVDRARATEFDELNTFLDRSSNYISYYSVTDQETDEQEMFRSDIQDVLPSIENTELLSDIIFEEGYFLLEESWLLSRTKKVFNYLKEAGVVILEYGEKPVRRTLNKDKVDHSELSNLDYLRSSAKWIGTGGSPALASLYPEFAPIIAGAWGLITLFDP